MASRHRAVVVGGSMSGLLAARGALRYQTVEGPRTGMVKFINCYIGKLHIAAAGDPAVALRILRGNLRKPPARH